MKKFGKRLLCLALALALCTAMMLPGFAATKPEDHVNCAHANKLYLYDLPSAYANYGVSGHLRYAYAMYSCLDCGQNVSIMTGTHYEAHTLPCSKCGGVTPR